MEGAGGGASKGAVHAIGGSFFSLNGQVLGQEAEGGRQESHKHTSLSFLHWARPCVRCRPHGVKKITLLGNQTLWSRKSCIIHV